tara:strand:- start:19 stop:1743 length:1725 start_codon:yes stop_codon:yes gene_type:complete
MNADRMIDTITEYSHKDYSELETGSRSNLLQEKHYISIPKDGYIFFIKALDIITALKVPYYLETIALEGNEKKPPKNLNVKSGFENGHVVFTDGFGDEVKVEIQYAKENIVNFVWADTLYVWEYKDGKMWLKGCTIVNGASSTALVVDIRNRIKSIYLNNRFNNNSDSFNVMVGDSVNTILDKFKLNIPIEQFVIPYENGITLIHKEHTNHIYTKDNKLYWSSFGGERNTDFGFLPPIEIDSLAENGRITKKSIHNHLQTFVDAIVKSDYDFLLDVLKMEREHYTNLYINSFFELTIQDCLNLPMAYYEVEYEEPSWINIALKEGWVTYMTEAFNTFLQDLLLIICLNDNKYKKTVLKKERKEIISKKTKMVGRRYFRWGENNVSYIYSNNNNKRTGIMVRHRVDGYHANRRIKYPLKHRGSFEMGGFWYKSVTIAPYYRGGAIGDAVVVTPLCFGYFGGKQKGGSFIASKWIGMIEKTLGYSLKHQENGGELRVDYGDNNWFYIDGYDKKTNTVYEFHGDYWHGNPAIYPPDEINAKNKKSMSFLYEATLEKEKILKGLGFTYVCMWEAEFQV